MQLIELKKDEIVIGFNDLNRLFDAVAYFKPVTVKNYAMLKGVSVQSVYKRIKRNTIMHFDIDGVTFIIE